MRSILLLLSLVSFAAITSLVVAISGYADPSSDDEIARTENSIRSDGKYALLVSTKQHLEAAIATGRQLKSTSPSIDFQIITCGQVVKAVANEGGVRETARQAVSTGGLKILACGMSLKQLDVDPALIPPEIPTTQNGLTYLFGLQEQGYEVIAL